MFTKETTTEDLIASIYSGSNGFIRTAAFNALEIRCGRESAVCHWKLAGNGEVSLPPASPAPEHIRIGEVLKSAITAYIHRSGYGKDFKPDTWGRIELECGHGDYREILVGGCCDKRRKEFVILTFDVGCKVDICGIDEIVRRFKE